MSGPIEDLAGLDQLVHNPARLAILTALSSCQSADFVFLQNITGLTKGNLSTHLGKLEGAEFVEIEKSFKGKKPNTRIGITEAGKAAVDRHWSKLENLRESSKRMKLDGANTEG